MTTTFKTPRMGPLKRARMKFAQQGGNEMTIAEIEEWGETLPFLEWLMFTLFGKGEDHDFADWGDKSPWRAIVSGLWVAGKVVGGILLVIAAVLVAAYFVMGK